MKILSASQIQEIDQLTIRNEPIVSIDLMERASKAFVQKFLELYPDKRSISVFAGTGNNGGDALAISRLLKENAYNVSVYVIGESNQGSKDFSINFKKIEDTIQIKTINSKSDFPTIKKHEIVIDGLFGSGLNRPVTGIFATLIDHLNSSNVHIVSIDIASGLFADEIQEGGSIVNPRQTITFQLPKLTFFQPSLQKYVGRFHVVDIKLYAEAITRTPTKYHYLLKNDVKPLLPDRPLFMHKGNAGRLQLITGSHGKMGAAILASTAALRSGVGLLHVQTPSKGAEALLNRLPEAMTLDASDTEYVTKMSAENGITALGIGPGLGTEKATENAFSHLINHELKHFPLILDADAINMVSKSKLLLSMLPRETILTPHPGEFKRLAGDWKNDFEKLKLLQNLAKKFHLNIVLKGAFSAICTSHGEVFFNSTGNPGMATAGSGDVLFGMICGLVAQNIPAVDALKLGVYLHGKAGDLAMKEKGDYALIASDIIEFLPAAFLSLTR